MEQIAEYGHKAAVLKRIMSNKARKYRWLNNTQNLITVGLTSFLGFMGFSGMEKVHTYLSWYMTVDKLKVEFAFNILIFGLFLMATLHLVFHFGRKETNADNAIVDLTNVINHVDDLLAKEEKGFLTLTAIDLENTRVRYESVTRSIPANSDWEYRRAKKHVLRKTRNQFSLTAQALFEERQCLQTLQTLVQRSDQVTQILLAIQQLDSRLYLGGGLVRNLVWDFLHGFKTSTPVDDVDVIYFDPKVATKDSDRDLEAKLRGKIPNLHWSVKNQARMHTGNGDAGYTGVEDAVSKWPETATCIAVRFSKSGELEVLRPHGLSDLFRLVVRPTPHFEGKPQRILDRASTKKWEKTWPKLELITCGGSKVP